MSAPPSREEADRWWNGLTWWQREDVADKCEPKWVARHRAASIWWRSLPDERALEIYREERKVEE